MIGYHDDDYSKKQDVNNEEIILDDLTQYLDENMTDINMINTTDINISDLTQ